MSKTGTTLVFSGVRFCIMVGLLAIPAIGQSSIPSEAPAVSSVSEKAQSAPAGHTVGPNLIRHGTFDNGIWYERYRGWSPSYWYQWFTRGDDAPEHAVGNRLPHSGKEYVRIHMWAHAWRGGILQNVKNVEPCRMYRLTAHGFFQPADAPEPNVKIGIDPAGTLAEQYSVDVSKHPAPKYDEGVGDDPKTELDDGPDVDDTTVWSKTIAPYEWAKLEVTAEARSDTITAILYCNPQQRPAEKPIYEMNWDTVSMVEVPWPTRRLCDDDAVLPVDGRFEHLVATVQPRHNTAQVIWKTKFPAGASQVLYRFLKTEADVAKEPERINTAEFSHESPVVYERSDTMHWVEIPRFTAPEEATTLEFVVLSRALIDGECRTLCSTVGSYSLD